MLSHDARRRLLHAAVTVLEPAACVPLVQHYLARSTGLVFTLLRIYVDLERLTREGHLRRLVRPRLGGHRTMFFYETLGLSLVEPDRPHPPRTLAAAAPLDLSVLDRLAPPLPDIASFLRASRRIDAGASAGLRGG